MLDFIPETPVLLAYTAAVIALTLTPGPDMTLFLSQTVSRSRLAGVAAYAGAATGLVCHTVFVAVGLSALLLASATAFTVLKVVGALYLLWLAVDAIRNGSSFHLSAGEKAPGSLLKVYAKGLLINLLNPKIIVFFITFLPQFVSPSDPDAAPKLLFLGVMFVVVATPITLTMIAFAGSLAALLKRSRVATRTVDWLFATVLGGFAIKLLATRAG
ncbi:LysE family translocator [Acuticoccus sp. MNP-M23]|uniref:LysE family translocator n=1 Tax=Acuticoccus sp. MNP-M23 TaxID=3072793 RepID=UPI0028153E4B|nr:LysE family translocator [Acuticoccus sp. MNP-M23]WMS43079.1 LysE family translocator [Acuticoccus sp. MNP-M23]